jgi:hypothetical protein
MLVRVALFAMAVLPFQDYRLMSSLPVFSGGPLP